jgi:PAS domain S-box-containing protein
MNSSLSKSALLKADRFKKMNDKDAFQALFENATEGIIVSNERGEIIMANPSSEKLFGYKIGELVGHQIEVLIPKKHADKHVSMRKSYMDKPSPRSMGLGLDLLAKKKDGKEFPVEISLSPLRSDKGSLVIAFIVDNSFRKQQEDILKQANAELEKRVEDRTLMLREAIYELEKGRQEMAQALEKEKELNDLKSRFVSMASHEFRTPLSTILSSVALISKYNTPETEDKKNKHIDRIKASVNHLTDILNDLLSLSKLEEGVMKNNPTVFNITKLSEDILQNMQALAKEGQTIVYKHDGGKNNVNVDSKFLRHIIVNLLSNAIKFSHEGTQIDFHTQLSEDILKITIRDRGLGIEEKDQKRLFERFFRASNVENIQGTGLGLNIVLKYVELMNGTVNFESKLNEGTTFIVNLPFKME